MNVCIKIVMHADVLSSPCCHYHIWSTSVNCVTSLHHS